jgi:transcriptional regulator with XRE-family HTH domain
MFEKASGQKIKEAIKKAGYTQEKFSKKIATKQSMISQWIIGKRNPTLRSLEKIAVATGKPLSYFFDNADSSLSDISVYGKTFGVVGHQNKVNTVNVNEQLKDYNKLLADKKDTEIELLKKEIENLKLKLEIEQLKNGKKEIIKNDKLRTRT